MTETTVPRPLSVPGRETAAGPAHVRRRHVAGVLRGVRATTGGVLGAGILTGLVLVAVLAPFLVAEPFASVGAPLQAPSRAHPFGTDDLGRDLLTMVVHGLRTSLVISVGAVSIAGVIALVVGAVAGSRPGWVDDLLMRVTELFQVVPRFFLAVLVVAMFGPGVRNLVLLLGLTSWTWTARVVRAETLSLHRRGFVEAARSFGAGHVHVLRRHVAPNVLPTALVMLSVCATSAVLLEAGLGFVGLADPDVVSLGSLANNAQRFLRSAWWLAVFPGGTLVLLVLSINLVGDALGDARSVRLGVAGQLARSRGRR